ncbi:MAG: glutathione S-transferase C-terminal domain-containing protein, partial [Pseudomonadota bacterium]
TCLVMTEIDAALWLKAKHRFALPAEHRLEGVGPVASFEYSRALAALGSMFEGAPYLAGDTPTVPDFILAHCLSWAVAAKMPDLPQELAQYHAAMTARPALAAAKAKGDSALA